MKILLLVIITMISQIVIAQSDNGFSFVERKDKKQVDVLYNGKLLTAYCYYDSIRKPILFPVNTLDGVTVTRGYPLQIVPGERTDHPHHTGIYLNYESVNGLDYWNNSTAIAPEKRSHYGTIVHQSIESKKIVDNGAILSTKANWVTPGNKVLLKENTAFVFQVYNNDLIIDRLTTLTATDTTVTFKDVKDGLFAIRVARELEMPSKEKSSFVDDKGNVTTLPPSDSGSVTGMYYSSEGLAGDSVWGKKAKWVMLTGKKDGKDITIGIVDNPKNPGYPAFWHARGYGLFAVNPLGRKIFSNGKEELNLTLPPKESVIFRYRIIIHSGKQLTSEFMDALAADFAN